MRTGYGRVMRKRLALVAVVLVALGLAPHAAAHRTENAAVSAPPPVEVFARIGNPSPTTTTTTEPAPPPTTAPPPRSTTTRPAPAAPEGSAADAVHRAFGDGPLFTQAWNVSDCESTHRPGAVAGNNYGLFQISDVHADDFATVTHVRFADGWSDPYLNAQYARALYNESGGWGPWGCRWAA